MRDRAIASRIAWVAGTAIAAAVGLGGCADLMGEARREAEHEAAPVTWPYTSSRDERERVLQQAWIGRTRDELLRSFGAPNLVMDVPGFRIPATFVIVYKNRDSVGRCIDAFVVLKDGDRISDYFCR